MPEQVPPGELIRRYCRLAGGGGILWRPRAQLVTVWTHFYSPGSVWSPHLSESMTVTPSSLKPLVTWSTVWPGRPIINGGGSCPCKGGPSVSYLLFLTIDVICFGIWPVHKLVNNWLYLIGFFLSHSFWLHNALDVSLLRRIVDNAYIYSRRISQNEKDEWVKPWTLLHSSMQHHPFWHVVYVGDFDCPRWRCLRNDTSSYKMVRVAV